MGNCFKTIYILQILKPFETKSLAMKNTLFIALCLILSHFSLAQGEVGDVNWNVTYDCSNPDSVLSIVNIQIISNGFSVDSILCTGFKQTDCFVALNQPSQTVVLGEFIQGSSSDLISISFEINDMAYTFSTIIEAIVPLQFESMIQHDCNSANAGQIDIIVTDPEMNYNVLWVPFNVDDDSFENLSPNTYLAIIEDFNCGSETLVPFTVFGALTIDSVLVSYDCYDEIGLLTPNISGNGSGDYTYLWTGPNGFTSSDAQPFISSPGNYNLSVTDNHSGCVDNVVVNVDANEGTIAPDGNCDCLVNSADLLLFLGAFGSSSNDPDFDWFWDLNSDGIVNSSDMLLLLGDNGSNVCD